MFSHRFLAIAALTLSLNLSAAEQKSKAQQQAEAELLELHQQDRHAHLSRDVNALLAHSGPQVLDVRDGKMRVMTRDEVRTRFTGYFGRTRFSAWDDVEPPVVSASKDGRMGWMVVRVHIVYTEGGPSGHEAKHDSIMAWMAAYEKRDGKWLMTAVASTSDEK